MPGGSGRVSASTDQFGISTVMLDATLAIAFNYNLSSLSGDSNEWRAKKLSVAEQILDPAYAAVLRSSLSVNRENRPDDGKMNSVRVLTGQSCAPMSTLTNFVVFLCFLIAFFFLC
jgi:hypothetical protein